MSAAEAIPPPDSWAVLEANTVSRISETRPKKLIMPPPQ